MLKIRDARLSDAREIAAIKVDTWKSSYKGIVPDDYLENLDYASQTQKYTLMIRKEKDTFVLVAEEDSKVVAFATGGKELTNEYNYSGEIYSIYVRDEFQKNGIGHQLVSEAAKRLNDMGISSMLVWALEESPFKKFYEEMKGKVVERMPFDLVDSGLNLIGYGWKDIDKSFVFRNFCRG